MFFRRGFGRSERRHGRRTESPLGKRDRGSGCWDRPYLPLMLLIRVDFWQCLMVIDFHVDIFIDVLQF